MDFPAYVPAGARAHIVWTLEGGGPGHWQGVNALIEEYRANPDTSDALEQERACYLRFSNDARMRDVYAELQKVFTQDDQYGEFLSAAWHAHMDYTPFREHMKKAKGLAPKIAKAARELATLLNEAGEVGGGVAPDEFFSICELLDKTDNTENGGHNQYIWAAVRKTITGTRHAPTSDDTELKADAAPRAVKTVFSDEEAEAAQQAEPNAKLIRVVVVPMKAGDKSERAPEEEARNMLHYAWGKAPHLPTILETVAQAAEGWAPRESGAIGAAIASRKASPTTEYLRAFSEHLRRDLPGVILSGSIVTAMAGTANVVLNDARLDVSTDDVRKAIAARPVEDSN
ncbi:hypothetical protein XACN24_09000 [Xanthomonas albilineans]|nr:hypothetical protein [Xanthomonas albilineans]QHQ28577.1 hypothetical protein XaFJ1_GM001842 [Xanthomonas albilineans]